MILPGSYANGFAPRDGQPLYPELWKGCVGAWAPCLGPTGLTLRDWSGFAQHGTLTNMDVGTDWVVDRGRYALDFDGTNDFVTASPSAVNIQQTDAFSGSAWIKLTGSGINSTAGRAIVNTWYQQSGWRFIVTDWPGTQGRIDFGALDGSGYGRLATGSTRVDDGLLHHVAFTYSGNSDASGIKLYVDGKPETTTIRNNASPGTLNNAGLAIGRLVELFYYFPGLISDVQLWRRELAESEVRLLSRRIGIAYELAPRRRSSSAVQFNRRRRLLLGAS